MNPSDTSFIRRASLPRFGILAQGIAAFVAAIGCLVLVGWLFDLDVLKSLVPGWPTMKSNTAVLLIVSAILLWIQVQGQRRSWLVWPAALLMLLVAGLTLVQFLFGASFGIDQLLFKDPVPLDLHPGRMSFFTAVSFTLLAFSFLSLHHASEKFPKEYFLIPVCVIAMLALIGYLYGVSSFYKFGAYASIAAHTAFSLLLLSIGIFFAQPDRGVVQIIWADTEGGDVLRRFLPVVFIFPVVLGWIRLQGQLLGLYDTAFGLAIMVMSLTGVLTLAVWTNARQLTQMQEQRRQAEVEQQESQQKYSLLFHKSAVPAAMLKLPEVRIIDVNEAMEKLVGFTKQEMYGKTAVELGLTGPAIRKELMEKFDAQHSLVDNEARIHTNTGEERVVLFNTNSLLLGGLPYAISTMQDITGRKQAEDEIVKLNAELEEKIEQRTKELALANQQLHQLSIQDELTGLHNRRGFLLLAEEQILLARRTARNLLIFYADLDGLKQINDQQGHAAGDRALFTVARILDGTFRVSDIKARLSGDEFIVLAIEASEPDIPTVLTRLRERLGEHDLSMSVGVVTIDPHEHIDLAELVTQADQAMYKVKLQKPGRHTEAMDKST